MAGTTDFSMAKVEIIEKEFVKIDEPIVIEGFPSVGLVGAIATEYLSTKLGMKEIGYLTSDAIPPVTIVKDGVPKSPIRIYSKDNLITFVSDTAVPPGLTHDVVRAIVGWAREHKAKKIISLGGIAKEGSGTKPTVYAVASDAETLKKLIDRGGYKTIKLGFLTGVFGILMLECLKENFESYGFLADAHLDVPDPGAAAAVLEALSKDIGIKIDTKSLTDTSAKIEKRLEQLMTQTKKSLKDPNYPPIYR